MADWYGRQQFDPVEEYQWIVTNPDTDTMCVFCGGALAEEDPAAATNTVHPDHDPTQWEPEDTVYAHNGTCPEQDTAVTIRTWSEQ